MLDTQILNQVIGTFIAALDGAFGALSVYSLGLVGVLGFLYLMLCLGQLVLNGHSLGALGDFLWVTLKIGVIYFFAFAFYNIFWTAAFYTFLQWGLEGGGGVFDYAAFVNPSAVGDMGFNAAAPLYDTLHNFGVSWLSNGGTGVTLLIAYWVVVFSFGVMALHVIMTILEIKLAIAAGAVLFPWAILT